VLVAPRPADPPDPNEQARADLDRLGIAYDIWDHGICDSLYLQDPEGHQIELTTYRS
jgi:catechol-2,3-dioxygenase